MLLQRKTGKHYEGLNNPEHTKNVYVVNVTVQE